MALAPLLLLDLDNTLIDRDAAWLAGLTEFYAAHGLPDADLDWVMRLDRRGHAPRAEVAEAMRDRYDGSFPSTDLWDFLLWGAASRAQVQPGVNDALHQAIASGWRPVVVTNGTVAQQSAKVRKSGLDKIVAGCVISEAVGARKPSPEIFHAAAAVVNGTLEAAWMIGDTEDADIGGPAQLGLSTVWLHRGRTWPDELTYRPTHVADTPAEAIQYVVTLARP